MKKLVVKYLIKRKCQHCHNDFYAYTHNVKKGFGKFCSKICSNKENNLGFQKGHKHFPFKNPFKAGRSISKAKKGISFTNKHKKALSISHFKRWDKIGRKKCENKDGRRKCKKCIEWRKKIFGRDDYTCQSCGVRGCYLEAHHIKSWAKFPKFRHVLSNGLTLCKKCHEQTDNYKRKNR